MPISTAMEQLQPNCNAPPTDSVETIPLELLAEWLHPEVTSGFDTIPEPYTPVDTSGNSSTSSPMMLNHDQASQNALRPAPQTPFRPHLQPPLVTPRPAPVPVGRTASPGNSPSPRRTGLRPERPSVRKARVEEAAKARTCMACRAAKASKVPMAQLRKSNLCALHEGPTRRALRLSTIKDITHQIRDLEVRIQQHLDKLRGSDGQESSDRLSVLESTEGRRCGCPVPAPTTSVTEGSTAPISAIVHRPGCPASDPLALYGRSRLMELEDPDSDAKENEFEEDTPITSEEEDRCHDLNLGMLMPASGTPAATFFELAHSLASPWAETLPSPTGSNVSPDVGMAGADYFTPNPAARPAIRKIMIERERLPSYLLNGTIKPAECNELFERFMSLWNVSVSVLDPGLHTSARAVLWRCPFLFTVVLAIAARDHKPEHYPILMQEARNMAGLALTTWSKSIEIVQAFILLATFPPPSKRWDEDRSWLYLGYATRMAGDLQLNRSAEHPFPSEMSEREHLNRIRTWLICHNLDVSAAAKLGKQTSTQEDPVILGSRTWWKSSKHNMKFDIHLCAFTQICIIFRKYFTLLGADSSSIYGFNNHVDVSLLAEQFTKEIEVFQADFESIFTEHSDYNDSACRYRAHVK
ncbi:unnamed protein product [Rhizoctonia solani]|uniref:Xylanolytic transcriptional activator regulatory domain-containing protein n=1 Tax=Rhizoctonia solani TaxID=456999 RepID=A0A8H2XW48_9AGAM|nr:unnamed protein product [Rhizoctonia solani]